MDSKSVPDLSTYEVSPIYGFLLDTPDTSLPEYFSCWENVIKEFNELLKENSLRKRVDAFPLLDHTKLKGYRQVRLGFTYLSFIASAYVWQDGDQGMCKALPRQIAIPLCALAQYLGTKPAVSHLTFCLSNWKKVDPDGPLHYQNLDTLVQFPGGDDSRCFITVTAQVELEAVPGIKACVEALRAVVQQDKKSAIKSLEIMKDSLVKMKETFGLLNKEVAPDVFFNSIRPFLTGLGGPSSILPEGLLFEGVSHEPIQFMGGNAGQSSTLPVFDATLGIRHSPEHQGFLDKVIYYMPVLHREFIFALRRAPSLSDFVESCKDPNLTSAYNDALTAAANFRTSHIAIVTRYILIPSKKGSRNTDFKNDSTTGTGGTAIMPFLKGLRDKTNSKRLP